MQNLITVIHDVSVDIRPRQRPFSEEEEAFETYIILTLETCHDHRTQPSYRAARATARQQFQRFSDARLQRGVAARDAPLMLEHCMRTIARIVARDTNAYVPDGIMAILSELAAIIPVSRTAQTRNSTRALRLQSLAVVVWLLFREYFRCRDTQSLHAVRSYGHTGNMVRFADACAHGGFVPPLVVRVADWFATFRARFGVDVRTALPDVFHGRTHFWSAYDAYVERQLEAERTRRAKVMKAPHLYACAASGCPVQAFKKGTLRQCGGSCPPETKPAYCSVECQARHWNTHRFTCKEGVVEGPFRDDNDPDWEDVETFDFVIRMQAIDFEGSWTTKRARELFIDIVNPSRARRGEVLRVRSRTLDPSFLKWYDLMWASKRRAPFKKIARRKDLVKNCGTDLVVDQRGN